MTNINFEKFKEVTVPLAKQAGQYQKSKLNTDFQIEYKSPINPVTEVDKACEKMIVEGILKDFSDHDVLAEEGSGERTDSEYKWIIDPLDGTVNYSHGYPMFCVSIGLEYQGQLLAGAVYDPMRDELFLAYKDHGAYLNGDRIRVSGIEDLQQSLLATGFAYNVQDVENNNLDHFENIILKSQAVRRDGVAALDLCYVACGRYEGFWELNLYPWDTAAGMLMITEAGGQVTRFDGSGYTVYEKDILATNGNIHQKISQLLTSGIQGMRP